MEIDETKFVPGEKGQVFLGMAKTEKMEGGKGRVLVHTQNKTRGGLLVLSEGIKMKNFKRHPVLLESHNRYDLKNIIGRWSKLSFDDKGALSGDVEYFVDREGGAVAWDLYEKNLAAFSISFNILDAIVGTQTIQESSIIPAFAKKQKPFVVFTEVELEEISQVVIPKNPEAVKKFCSDNPDDWEGVVKMASENGYYEVDPFTLPEEKERDPSPTELSQMDSVRLKMLGRRIGLLEKKTFVNT